jgi:hypothetical protein
VEIGDGDDQNFVLADMIDQPVREAPGSATSQLDAQRLPRFRVASNAFDGTDHFRKEDVAESLDSAW